jgi:class 3 adenylate cyclase
MERPDDLPVRGVRISDAERNQAVELLRHHCAEGRITLDEFSDRVGDVFEARTTADLELVTRDLPVASPPPVETTRRKRASQWIFAVMSGTGRKGRWRPAETTKVLAVMGGVELDLREALLDGPELTIHAIAIMGGIDIVVPEGIRVEVRGLPIMGGFDSRIRDVPVLPGSPVIHVTGWALMGGVSVRNKRPRSIAHAVDRARDVLDEVFDRLESPPARPGIPAPPAPPGGRDKGDDWREQLRTHAAPDGTVTILFSDIAGYTEMTERLGDLRARDVLYDYNAIVREQLATHDGYEVKSQGDGFMIAFAGASRALRCSIAIQRAFVDYSMKHPEAPLRVHIGLHTGEAIREADDFLGRTVIIASRVASTAKGDEILVTSLLKELTDGRGEFSFGDCREVSLKGLSSTYRLYPVVWQS